MMIEIPEWAESLHNGYNAPPKDVQEIAERFFIAVGPGVEAFIAALHETGQSICNAFQACPEMLGELKDHP